MKYFLLLFNFLASLGEGGMAVLNGANYQKSQNFPLEKADPTEINARVKCIHEVYLMNAIIATNDEIDMPSIPEGALVKSAAILIDGSTGAGGIFDLGLRAFTDLDENAVVEDSNSLVQAADAGGQAVNKRDAAASILGSILGKIGKGGAQLFATCTEATTTTVATPRTIEIFVEYMLES